MFGIEVSAIKDGWVVYKWSKYEELFGRVTELMTWLKVARLDFFGGYLPRLSIDYVGMSKDMEKRLPQLY